MWERFRCKVKDSDNITIELSLESSHPDCGRIFCRFPDISRIFVICGPMYDELVSFLLASLSTRSVLLDANNEIHQPDDSGWVCVSAMLTASMYGCLFGRWNTGFFDTSFRVSGSIVPSWTLSSCRPIPCGTSSPQTTSALVECVVPASCDIGQDLPMYWR